MARRDYSSKTPLPLVQKRDLANPPCCYLLWGVPGVVVFATFVAYDNSVISIDEAGLLWSISVAWAGIGCLVNAVSCGRVHCRVDGILLPALSIVGLLNALSVISIGWSLFWLCFFVILAGGFILEWSWRKYS
jgi:hypothetical protein